MSDFVKVYVSKGSVDKILQKEKILHMRGEDSPFIQVERTDLRRALSLPEIEALEPRFFGRNLVVIDGYVDAEGTHSSIGSKTLDIWQKIATENKVVIRLNNAGARAEPERTTEGEYYINLFSWPASIGNGGPYPEYLPPVTLSGGVELKAGRSKDLQYIRGAKPPIQESGEFELIEGEGGNGSSHLLAAMKPHNAWILLRCGRTEDVYYNQTVTAAFTEFFERVFYATQVENIEEFMEAQRVAQRAKQLEAWGKLVAGRHDERVKECRDRLLQFESELVDRRKDVTDLLRSIETNRNLLKVATEVRPDVEGLAVELDKLHENPWIDRVEFGSDGEFMKIFTRNLVMDGDEDIRSTVESVRAEWAGLMVPIGKFIITMHGNGDVQIENTTPKKTEGRDFPGWHHPHIPIGNRPCFGTIERALPQLLAKYAFAEAAHLLLGYLTCCNADDSWGMNIELWREDAFPKSLPDSSAQASEGGQEAQAG